LQFHIEKISGREGIWTHQDVLDVSSLQSLRQYAKFLTNAPAGISPEQRIIRYGDQTHQLVSFNGQRNYQKIWSLPDEEEYWHQTADTIFNWANRKLQTIHPGLRRTLQEMRKLEPLNDGREWVPFRCIFNNLVAGVALDAHIDGSSGFEYDVTKHWLYSSTVYLEMPNEGGFVWDELGTYFQPKVNSIMTIQSAIVRNGRLTPVCHGVTPGSSDRLGFTVRWLPVDFMYLPGDPLKMIYQTQKV
jgi:hypothetical protein